MAKDVFLTVELHGGTKWKVFSRLREICYDFPVPDYPSAVICYAAAVPCYAPEVIGHTPDEFNHAKIEVALQMVPEDRCL